MQSRSSGSALLACKCPRCREGNMFKYTFGERWFSMKMYENCPRCDQSFEPEPGFYFGAMFISYAFSTAITLTIGFILYNFFGHPSIWVYLAVVSTCVAVLWPLMFKYSRSIFLHLAGGIRFNPKYSD